MATNPFEYMFNLDRAQAWMQQNGLPGMTQDQARQFLLDQFGGTSEDALRSALYGEQALGPLAPEYGGQEATDRSTPATALTPDFDPTVDGGVYGRYAPVYDNQGRLTDVQFQKGERSGGFIGDNLEWIGPLLVGGAAALGGGFLGGLGGSSGSGTIAGGAAGDAFGAGSLGGSALGSGITPGAAGITGITPGAVSSGIGGGALGTGLTAAGSSWMPFAAESIGSIASGLGAAGGAAGGGGAGGGTLSGITSALGGAQGIGTIAGGLAGGLGSAMSQDSETIETRPYVDPRVDAMLMGQGGQPGYLQNLLGMGAQGLPQGMQDAASASGGWLSGNTQGMLGLQQAGIQQQMAGQQAPSMQGAQMSAASAGPFAGYSAATGGPAAQAAGVSGAGTQASAGRTSAARINAPGQNELGLTSAFDDYIYGDQAQNQYLQGALQRGADQSRYNFQNLLSDQNTQFAEDVLGNIRGGAIQAGGLGGSRQGIAEGIAARELAKQQGRAATQYGQDLNSAMIGAQSENFMQGRNLGAGLLGGLSGQQYGLATDQAGLTQGANNLNAQLGTQASIANAGNATNLAGVNANVNMANMSAANQMAQFNAAQQNAAGQFNAGAQNQMGQFNAGLLQNANLANQASTNLAGTSNLQSQLGTNALNSANLQSGIGNAGNMLNAAYNLQSNAFQAPLNQASQALGAATPAINMYGSGSNTTSPLYNNWLSSALGGAQAGAQLGRLWG